MHYYETLDELKKHITTQDFREFVDVYPDVKRVIVDVDGEDLSDEYENSYHMTDNDVVVWF